MTDISHKLSHLLAEAKKLELQQLDKLIEKLKDESKARHEIYTLERDLSGIREFLHHKVKNFLAMESKSQGIQAANHIVFHNGKVFSNESYNHKRVMQHPGYMKLLEELQKTYELTAEYEYYDDDYGTTCLHIKEIKGILIISSSH